MDKWSLAFIHNHRDQIISISFLHCAHNLRIFGSYVRGDQISDGDLDLLADIDPDRNLLDQVVIIRELEEFLNMNVDPAESTCFHKYIRSSVLSDAIPL